MQSFGDECFSGNLLTPVVLADPAIFPNGEK